MISTTLYASPVGDLRLAASEVGLCALYFENQAHRLDTVRWQENRAPFDRVMHQLDGYFSGRRQSFDVALDLQGSPFQLRVWQMLRAIPYGTTISYGELARRIGQPKAARAVGLANGRNPVSIIVPCHRVIGANGQLTGFGGGMPRKAFLLHLEQQEYALVA